MTYKSQSRACDSSRINILNINKLGFSSKSKQKPTVVVCSKTPPWEEKVNRFSTVFVFHGWLNHFGPFLPFMAGRQNAFSHTSASASAGSSPFFGLVGLHSFLEGRRHWQYSLVQAASSSASAQSSASALPLGFLSVFSFLAPFLSSLEGFSFLGFLPFGPGFSASPSAPSASTASLLSPFGPLPFGPLGPGFSPFGPLPGPFFPGPSSLESISPEPASPPAPSSLLSALGPLPFGPLPGPFGPLGSGFSLGSFFSFGPLGPLPGPFPFGPGLSKSPEPPTLPSPSKGTSSKPPEPAPSTESASSSLLSFFPGPFEPPFGPFFPGLAVTNAPMKANVRSTLIIKPGG